MGIKTLFVEILALVLAAVLKNRKSRASKREAPPEDNNIFQVNLIKHQEILPARWDEMARQKREDKDFGFEAWRYDPATEAQKDRLLREGASKNLFTDTTKGQASDLIGISQPADPELVDVLQYFKLWEDGMSQTAACDASRRLWLDPEKIDEWKNRTSDHPFDAGCEGSTKQIKNIKGKSKNLKLQDAIAVTMLIVGLFWAIWLSSNPVGNDNDTTASEIASVIATVGLLWWIVNRIRLLLWWIVNRIRLWWR